MTSLDEQVCEVCQEGASTVTDEEEKQLLAQLTGWQIETQNTVKQLLKVYTFDNFVGAMAFARQVGELAESVGHHPALLVEWGRVTVRWWTHKINGLHQSDFVMAAKTDSLIHR